MLFESLDATLLSRIQFAFTISFHIIFPAFTIGLASWLAVLEGLWLKTKQPVYKEIYLFWVKIFAVAFGLGVVSGVVMSYQFGTNWSTFSDAAGNVIGPLLGFEVMTAFFLEASFLGIMLFGWNKVGPRMHFASTIIVAIGTLVSAFWILSASSFMHTPQGFTIQDGILFPSNWIEVIFNPSFPYRLTHMVIACYLTTACVVAGVSAWYLKKHRFVQAGRIMLAKAMLIIAILAPLQLFVGDSHGLNTLAYQPVKVSAMEGIWEDTSGAGLILFGIPNMDTETTDYKIEIPKLASLILTKSLDGEVKGLKSWPKSERPHVAWVFFSFRVMVGIGLLMILTAVFALYLQSRRRLFSSPWFCNWCIMMGPLGFVAVLAGWFVTEIGRQPYLVYGILRTADMASPVTAEVVAGSLISFMIAYAFVFGAGIFYIFHLIAKGPNVTSMQETFGQHVKRPVTLADVFRFGGKHV